MSASIFNTLTMKLTTMKQPNPLAAPPSPSTLLYDWVVRSGSYDERPARLYLTARLPETLSRNSSYYEPYASETQTFQPDVLIDIPPTTTLKDMSEFAETGATMIQFFTMPRNNVSVFLCSCIIIISLVSALLYRNYTFASIFGLSVSLTIVTVVGGGANQQAKTIQEHTRELRQKKVLIEENIKIIDNDNVDENENNVK
jgi:hypothetical protein